MPKIQIITGSTRPNRVNHQVAEWIHSVASQRSDLEVEIVDIQDFNLPLLDEPMSAMMAAGKYQNEHTTKWSTKIAEADAYIFVTPEYNHSTSAALKNAIDYLYVEWNNKPAAIVSYGVQKGVRAAEHLRGILAQLQVPTVAAQVTLDLITDFEGFSTLKDLAQNHVTDANTQLDQLTAWATALKTIR